MPPLPSLNLDVLSNVLAYFEKSEDVSSFMLACRAFHGLSIPHFLDPKREGVKLDNERDALLFINFMSAASHSYRRFSSLSDLRITINFHRQSEDFVNPDNTEVIGRKLAEIVRRSVNLERLSFNDSILDLDDLEIVKVFKNDLKAHKRLKNLRMRVAGELGCQLLEEIEAPPVADLWISSYGNIIMGPEVILPFASTVTSLSIDLPSMEGLRDVCCPHVRALSLSTPDNIVTSDLLRAFPRIQDLTLEDVCDGPELPSHLNDTRALARRANNQSLLVRDKITTLKLRYAEGPPTRMYMMGFLPEVREIHLLDNIGCDEYKLTRSIQVVRDCSPKAVRIEIRGRRQHRAQEIKDMLQELSEILKASGATHLCITFELTGQALLACMSTIACILSKFTSLKYLVVRIHYWGYSNIGIILEPHALDASETRDAGEGNLNVGLLECMADEIAKGIPSLKQVGIDYKHGRRGPQRYWDVFRRGDKRGDSEVGWLTLVPLCQYKGEDAALRFWDSTKAKDASLRPSNHLS